jgi:hypothetical protein
MTALYDGPNIAGASSSSQLQVETCPFFQKIVFVVPFEILGNW